MVTREDAGLAKKADRHYKEDSGGITSPHIYLMEKDLRLRSAHHGRPAAAAACPTATAPPPMPSAPSAACTISRPGTMTCKGIQHPGWHKAACPVS